MSYQKRKELISNLEKVRGSRVLCYFLSDRGTFPPGIPGFSTNLGTEPQLLFADQLHAIGKTTKIDFFLYTRGGDTNSVWPLVNLLREYCEKLTVIVPFRAHSGGTLICLGADEIIMTEFAELSPIDPTTGNQFNPQDPSNPQARFGISVEDVAAYFTLSKDRAEIRIESYRFEVFKLLVSNVHPLALGNVQRVYMQIRQLAKNLLALHMDENNDGGKIEDIVTKLTEKFFSHVHAISRREAISLLNNLIKIPEKEEESIIFNLFNSYSETLDLRYNFNLPEHIGDNLIYDLKPIGAFIESTELSHIYTTDIKVAQRPNLPANVQIQIPPNQPIPLVPWVGRTYDWGIQRIGWRINDAGL